MTPEGEVKKKGRDICNKFPIFHFPVNMNGFGNSGIPDDCLCFCSLTVMIEYKARMNWAMTKMALRSLPRDNQIRKMEALRNAGGVSLVVDDANLYSMEGIFTEGLSIVEKLGPDCYIKSLRDMFQSSILGWNWTWEQWNHRKELILQG